MSGVISDFKARQITVCTKNIKRTIQQKRISEMFGGDSSYLSHSLYVMVGSIRYTEYYEVVSLRHFST